MWHTRYLATKYVEKLASFKLKFIPLHHSYISYCRRNRLYFIIRRRFLHIIKTIHKFTTHKLDHLKPYLCCYPPFYSLKFSYGWVVSPNTTWNILKKLCGSSPVLYSLSYLSIFYLKLKLLANPVKSIYYLYRYCFVATLFAAFLALVDIPMYIRRFNRNNITEIKDIKSFFRDFEKKHKINFDKRLDEMKKCQQVDNSLETWKEEIPWLTGYFTIGVWSSFALAIWHKYHTS